MVKRHSFCYWKYLAEQLGWLLNNKFVCSCLRHYETRQVSMSEIELLFYVLMKAIKLELTQICRCEANENSCMNLQSQNIDTVNESDDDGMWITSVNDCHRKSCIGLSVVLMNWICELNASHVYMFACFPFPLFRTAILTHYQYSEFNECVYEIKIRSLCVSTTVFSNC